LLPLLRIHDPLAGYFCEVAQTGYRERLSMTATQFSGPWLPWFHGDFLRATQGWTVTERGVYFLLLGASWEMGPLPNDRRRLAGIVGAQLDEFDDAWKVVNHKFTVTAAGLVNNRLEIHREKQAIRSEKARQSVSNRWNRTRECESDTNVDTNESKNGGKSDTFPILEGIRSGYSSELRSQNSKKDKNSTRPTAVYASAAFHEQVIDTYHRLCPHMRHVKTWPKHRKAKLNARIRERCADGKPADTLAWWEGFFESVAESDFLSGRTDDPFRPTLEWLISPENFPKVIEGNYENRKATNGARAHG
jgi:uncharacterized protein YdaU (DUF1376 family)